MAESDQSAVERFTAIVRDRAGDMTSRDQALQVTDAVLAELGRRLTGGAADRLASALPNALGSPLRQASRQGEGAGTDEFLAGVAEREGSDDPTAVAGHVQAVFRAVAETVDRQTIDSVREQLTAELRRLWTSESEGDTSQVLSSGPMDPDAPNVAGPERRAG